MAEANGMRFNNSKTSSAPRWPKRPKASWFVPATVQPAGAGGHRPPRSAPPRRALASGRHRLPRAGVRLLAPIDDPEKVICVGLNYRDHCLEQDVKVPKEPLIFSKFPSAIAGPPPSARRPRSPTCGQPPATLASPQESPHRAPGPWQRSRRVARGSAAITRTGAIQKARGDDAMTAQGRRERPPRGVPTLLGSSTNGSTGEAEPSEGSRLMAAAGVGLS
ncbi:uncharacterized protein LOC110387034 [Numida meleagris]|uniref:uncharacterized protein LOC110387034 n=1 Tax=Numida meleagris TaxID=8996 RepID=UPI000B3D893D|nr:uncharacterized protein LOC110387034 [Numida meleagris]